MRQMAGAVDQFNARGRDAPRKFLRVGGRDYRVGGSPRSQGRRRYPVDPPLIVGFCGDGGSLMTGQELATGLAEGRARSSSSSTTRCTARSA
jgi:hypothetical protein